MKVLNINGFSVLYCQTPHDRITVKVLVEAGSINEMTPQQYGVAHYLEHVFFKGTTSKPAAKLMLDLSRLGEQNAFTSNDRTGFYINTVRDNMAIAADLLCEMMFESVIPPSEFDKERNVILEEIQTGLDNPSRYFWNNAIEQVFGQQGHRIIGSIDSVSKLSVGDLMNFRNKYYAKNNMLFIVAGNVSEVEVTDSFEKALRRGIHAPEKASLEVLENAISFVADEYHFNHASEQAQFAISMRGPSYAEQKAMKNIDIVFENGFAGGMHSILFSKVREELGLCYQLGVSNFDVGTKYSTFIYSQMNKDNVGKARDAIQSEFDKVCQQGFPDELLSVAKDNAMYQYAGIFESAVGVGSMTADMFLSGTYDLNDANYAYFRDKIRNTTNDEIIKYANWLKEDGSRFICMNG